MEGLVGNVGVGVVDKVFGVGVGVGVEGVSLGGRRRRRDPLTLRSSHY